MLDDIRHRLRVLEGARSMIGDTATEGAIAGLRLEFGAANVDSLLAELRAQYTRFGPIVQVASADGGGHLDGVTQTVVLGDQHVHPLPENTELARQQVDLSAYLRWIRSFYNQLPMSSLDPSDVEHAPLELSEIYIDIEEGAPTERGSTGTLQSLSSSNPQLRHVLLLGGLGSGKTSLLNHLVACLAGACCSERHPDDPQPTGGWLAKLNGWDAGTLLPIPILLRDFAVSRQLIKARKPSLATLAAYLKQTLHDVGYAQAFKPLYQALLSGGAILLLDGLDEVGDVQLERVKTVINAAQACPSPLLVTCRQLDYDVDLRRHLSGFTPVVLGLLSEPQVGLFIERWHTELVRRKRKAPAEAIAQAARLRDTIDMRSELRELARSPLLLTLMTLVHNRLGQLPDARTLLYYECIAVLVDRWSVSRRGSTLREMLGLANLSDVFSLLGRLGFWAHDKPPRANDNDAPADLTDSEIIAAVREHFDQISEKKRLALAGELLEAMKRGEALLLTRGHAHTFPHRGFQEFLAGYHLLGLKNHLPESERRAADPRWHEAILLMTSYRVLSGNSPEQPLTLVEHLLKRGVLEQVLAGEILVLAGYERVARYDPAMVTERGLWGSARRKLAAIALGSQRRLAAPGLRLRAGRALGEICFGQLAVLLQMQPQIPLIDVRLPLALLGLKPQHRSAWLGWLAAYWARPIGELPLWIGRYLVTNADYARFIVATGAPEPVYWSDPRYNTPTQPVVGVTWFHAHAYCQWLTTQGHAQGWLAISEQIRLPTLNEWRSALLPVEQPELVLAAIGPEIGGVAVGRHPAPTPVGIFPLGRSYCGAMDLLGNVWEWNASSPGQIWNAEPATEEPIYVCGGCVLSALEDLTGVPCEIHLASHTSPLIGFRLARSDPNTESRPAEEIVL